MPTSQFEVAAPDEKGLLRRGSLSRRLDCSDFANQAAARLGSDRPLLGCVLYGVPALVAAGLVFLRRDVAES